MGRGATLVLLTCVATLLPSGRAGAALDEWAIGAKAGTLGVGGELTTNLVPDVHLRGAVQGLDLELDDVEFDDIEYDADLDLFNPSLLLDWYPGGSGFRVSIGAIFNGTDIDVTATSAEPIEIGDSIYQPEDIGSIRGDADFEDVAPYIGIGFGNPLSGDRRWGFTADFGVAYIGSPDVDLRITGPFADNALLQADLAEEEEEIEDDLDNFRFFPVLSVTVYYRF